METIQAISSGKSWKPSAMGSHIRHKLWKTMQGIRFGKSLRPQAMESHISYGKPYTNN